MTEPSTKSGWSQTERPAREFAVGQANLHDKTEIYEIFRHPEGGRKDILRWAAAEGKPVAELEIYRPGGELDQQRPRRSRLSPPGWIRAARGNSKPQGSSPASSVPVTLLGLTGSADAARACLGFIKRIDDPPLRISGWSCQGDDLPARRAAVSCMLNRLVLLTAGSDTKLAELFARAELRRSDCPTTAASALSADWVTGADNPRLRGAM